MRQYELGKVPQEMAEEKDEAATPPDGAERREEGKEERWRWLRFWRWH